MTETNRRIIEAADTPASIGPGDLALTIAWPDGEETIEHVSERAAAALGYQRPSEPPAPPAWMVEVAREAGAQCVRAISPSGAASYRAGQYDDAEIVKTGVRALRLALERGHVVEPREWTEEELLAAAVEDAAQVSDRDRPHWSRQLRHRKNDDHADVLCALQARRNMLLEGVVAGAAAPVRDRDGNPPVYAPGDHVQKTSGDYQIGGIVRGVILTGAGLWRYAVEHQAEGGGAFLHIYAAANLSSTLPNREA